MSKNNQMNYISPNQYLDSTLLKKDSTNLKINELYNEALENNIKGICIYSEFIKVVENFDSEKFPLFVTVSGFPTGDESTKEKVLQTKYAFKEGADEVDVVLNIGALFDKRYKYVLNDLIDVVNCASDCVLSRGIITKPVVKVIIETSALREEELKYKLNEGDLIRTASEITAESGADFVKTSTGMHSDGGCGDKDVEIIKSVVKDELKIKAAGGIRDYDRFCLLVGQGADRVGTSNAMHIIEGYNKAVKKLETES